MTKSYIWAWGALSGGNGVFKDWIACGDGHGPGCGMALSHYKVEHTFGQG